MRDSQEYGRSICEDARRCEGLLRDLCGGYRREINALVNALKRRTTDELLDASGAVPQEVLVARLAKKLEDDLGLDKDLARWSVITWGIALGRFSDGLEEQNLKEQEQLRLQRELEDERKAAELRKIADENRRLDEERREQERRRLEEEDNRNRQDRRNDKETIFEKMRKGKRPLIAGVTAAVAVVMVVWFWFVPSTVKVQSIKFFGAPDGLAAHIASTTPSRGDYKSTFRSDETPFIYYELRLTQPAPSDIALDVTWVFPDGSKVSQERLLKVGSLGTIYGRGSSRGPPNWRVGRYALDFSWQGKKLASAEFNVFPKPFFPVPPPIADFDGISLQVNVSGHMRFYEGPSQVPPIGSRQYRNAFDGKYVRWVWCEIYLSNAGNQAPRNFTVTNVIYRNGARLARWTNTFMSPQPRDGALYSISYGSERMGFAPGAYAVQIYLGNRLLSTGQFTVW